MSLFRPTSEISATPTEVVPPVADPAVGGRVQCTSEILNEAMMASSYRVRDSLPEQHREHFNTLRQEIIDFAKAHGIPRESLTKPQALVEAAQKLSTPDLQQLALLLEHFEHLLVHKEPAKEPSKFFKEAERLYGLKEQYDFQVSLLEQAGILKDGVMEGIDGEKYPIPTLEQIAQKLYEQRETLETKRDQGFTKLLLVPFGMSLHTLMATFKQFLLDYQKIHPRFGLRTEDPLWVDKRYDEQTDVGASPLLRYFPKFLNIAEQSYTKAQVLALQKQKSSSVPGWRILLLQASEDEEEEFAKIPRKRKGTIRGKKISRPDIETGELTGDYLALLVASQTNPSSPYYGESGMTPEDWIVAFMTQLSRVGRPLDSHQNGVESRTCLIGAHFPRSAFCPEVYFAQKEQLAGFYRREPYTKSEESGVRTVITL